MNFIPMQGNVVFYACNKFGHIAKYCRRRNMNKRGLENKNKNEKPNDKGKEKVEEIKDQMKKTWVKKTDLEAGSGSATDSGNRTTFGN